MSFLIIRGTYHVVGYSPDGDSIRFNADNDALWSRLSGPPVKINGRGHAQLRLEGIDTLETHFGLGLHQPIPHALGAVEQLLADLDIRMWKTGSASPARDDRAAGGAHLRLSSGRDRPYHPAWLVPETRPAFVRRRSARPHLGGPPGETS